MFGFFKGNMLLSLLTAEKLKEGFFGLFVFLFFLRHQQLLPVAITLNSLCTLSFSPSLMCPGDAALFVK